MSSRPVRMLFDFEGKVAVVTGSGQGIGAGIALRFAEAGADVGVHYHTSLEGARDIVSQINQSGVRTAAFQADLSRTEEVQGLINQSIKTFGHIDILVNNAGIYPVSPLTEMDPEDWHKVIDANLTAAYLCTQAAARKMIERGKGGVIINISSIEAQNPTLNHAHYCAAKAGLDQFSRTAANEFGKYGIRVNVVSPGLIWREGLEENWPEGVERWMKAVPLGRLGLPEDVSNACLFLASPASSWITGANLVVDGGILTNQVY
ncbi:MAG: SDR family oxidoreductase [Anaerolineaceae bacterium]|nr:SDR family oxidoreductase [Anaerolineaceae bacterium]